MTMVLVVSCSCSASGIDRLGFSWGLGPSVSVGISCALGYKAARVGRVCLTPDSTSPAALDSTYNLCTTPSPAQGLQLRDPEPRGGQGGLRCSRLVVLAGPLVIKFSCCLHHHTADCHYTGIALIMCHAASTPLCRPNHTTEVVFSFMLSTPLLCQLPWCPAAVATTDLLPRHVARTDLQSFHDHRVMLPCVMLPSPPHPRRPRTT